MSQSSGASIDVFNTRFAVKVSSSGRFNLGALPDASGGQGPNSWDLMYRWPSTPSTSFSTLRIDGADSVYGSTGSQIEAPTDIDSSTNRSKWKIGDIEVTQIIQVVLNPQTLQNDVAKISYTTRNTGSVTHNVGLRVMIDTEINYNDGAPFRVPGTGIITTESEFTGGNVPDTFQTFFNVTDNSHVAISTLRSGGATTPDRLVFARWPGIQGTNYDYIITPGDSLTSDSAYALYWNPTSLAAGASRTVTTFYGLANLQVDLLPPLALGVSAPATLSVVNGQYSPNPFDVTATVFNNGNGAANGVALTLNLPAGLSLASGSATQTVGDLPAGQERQVSWSVRANPQPAETTVTFSVTASATNAQSKTVQRQITLGKVVLPVIFIPGIAGSRLNNADGQHENLWPGLATFHDGLTLDPNDSRRVPNINPVDVIRSVALKQVYQPLINRMEQEGYHESGSPANLFVFAFDWRLSMADNTSKLKELIDHVRTLHQNSDVDVIAHSTGGLLARRYIIEQSPNNHHVHQLVTIGSPWLGAPKAINVLETGDFGVPFFVVLKRTIKRIAERFPGVHQLLPSQSYIELGGVPFSEDGWDINRDNSADGNYNYAQFIGFMDDRFRAGLPGSSGKAFHDFSFNQQHQDDWHNDNSGVKYYHIYGVRSAQDTISNMTAWSRRGLFGPRFELRLKYDSGDGTVPRISAERPVVNGHSFNAPGAALHSFFPPRVGIFLDDSAVEHNGLTKNPAVQTAILCALRSANPNTCTNMAIAEDATEEVTQPSYYLSLSGVSSVEVTDSSGNTSHPLADETDEGVPGVTANIKGLDALDLITSTDGTYTIKFGSGSELIDVEATKGANNQTLTNASRYHDLLLPAGVTAMIKTTPQGIEVLRYDANGDGTFETSVTPTATVSGTAAQDVTPPVLSVGAVPQQNNVNVTLLATDGGSGVKGVFYSFDGITYQPYTGTLSVDPRSRPVIYAFAEDNVANRSSIVTYFPVVSGNRSNNAQFFVRQHYYDFLSRDPDNGGLSFWTNQITSCGSDSQCIELKRINVSAAYFLSIEFQETGYLVYRTYKAAYGNIAGAPVPVRYAEFLPDTQEIGNGVQVGIGDWQTQLANNKAAFALEFVSRSRFAAAYPLSRTPAQFVDALFLNAGVTPSATDRNAAINEFNGAGNTSDLAARARSLRRVAENSALGQAEFNKAFVLMQYFGYLRRNPNDPPEAGLDFGGFNFWLGKLNQFNGNFVNAEMVKAFIVSGEYRQRFAP